MAYILDNKKKDTTSYILNVDGAGTVSSIVDTQFKAVLSVGPDNSTKYEFPTAKAPTAGYTLVDTSGTGELKWEPLGVTSPVLIFERITTLDTNYALSIADSAIEIVSDTYNTVTLPYASGLGGRMFFISRASDNNNLKLVAQSGDYIDGLTEILFQKKYTHITVMSNDVNRWYTK